MAASAITGALFVAAGGCSCFLLQPVSATKANKAIVLAFIILSFLIRVVTTINLLRQGSVRIGNPLRESLRLCLCSTRCSLIAAAFPKSTRIDGETVEGICRKPIVVHDVATRRGCIMAGLYKSQHPRLCFLD